MHHLPHEPRQEGLIEIACVLRVHGRLLIVDAKHPTDRIDEARTFLALHQPNGSGIVVLPPMLNGAAIGEIKISETRFRLRGLAVVSTTDDCWGWEEWQKARLLLSRSPLARLSIRSTLCVCTASRWIASDVSFFVSKGLSVSVRNSRDRAVERPHRISILIHVDACFVVALRRWNVAGDRQAMHAVQHLRASMPSRLARWRASWQ